MAIPSDRQVSLLNSADLVGEPAFDGSAGPKYEQLRRQIIEQITTGRLKPGDVLPTERCWAEANDLARSTVRQAMSLLERDGLILRVQGRGTFVHEQARDRCRRGLDVFALVLPETEAGYYPTLQRSFDEAAAHVHHQLLVCNTANNVDRQGNIILQLMDKQVAGVALVPVTSPATPAYQIRQLRKAGIPLVFCHRRVEGVKAPLLAIPFPKVGQLVARTLADHGHRRVGFVAMVRSTSSSGHEAALRAGLAEVGGVIPDGCCFHGTHDLLDTAGQESEIAGGLAAMMEREDRPTALFASFDSLAELVYMLLTRWGLRVPDDISLIGFGGMTRTSPLSRRLTSATIDEVELGHRAAALLEQMRRGELSLDDNETHGVTVGLSQGHTLGPVPSVVRPLHRGVQVVHA